MLADTSPQFSPPARLERGIAECRHAIAGASLPPGLSNAAYLWGGTRAPDPFLVAAVADGKIVARPYEPAAGLMEKLEAFVEKGEDGGGGAAACAELDAMIAADPAMPLLNYLASGCRQAAGDEGGARAHVERELALNPAHPESLLAAASFLFHDGKTAEATRAAALAAAFWPAWDMPGKLLAAVPGAPCVAAGRAFDPEILVETNLHGAVLAAAPDGEPWLAAYARCRAAMRYCPEARMSFGMKAAPAAPGLVEEMACLTVAAGAGGGASPQLAFLREARDLGWLMEFALVEVIGAHRPDYLKFLPAAVKGSILDYVVAMRLQGAGGGPCTALEGKE